MTSIPQALHRDVRKALAEDLVIDITTKGRNTGTKHRTEIWFLNIDDVVYITGTPGPRDWFANLKANPSFTFHLKESIEADVPALATVVDDPAERATVFGSMSARYYRQNAEMDDLMESSPMVRVLLRGTL